MSYILVYCLWIITLQSRRNDADLLEMQLPKHLLSTLCLQNPDAICQELTQQWQAFRLCRADRTVEENGHCDCIAGSLCLCFKGWFEPFHLRSLIPRHTMIGTVIYSMVDSMLSSLWNITGLPKFTLRHVASQRPRRRRRHGRPWKTWTYGTESNSFDQNSGDRINQIRAAFSYGIGRIGIPIPWDS